MNAKRIARAGLLGALAVAAASTTGCQQKISEILVPNVRPTVRLTAAPFVPSRASPYFYAYRMDWVGFDADGRVDYFLYAVDPPTAANQPIPWVRTTGNEQIVFFTADSSNVNTGIATRPHSFAICAVDHRGDTSLVVERGFYLWLCSKDSIKRNIKITTRKISSLHLNHPRKNQSHPKFFQRKVLQEFEGKIHHCKSR